MFTARPRAPMPDRRAHRAHSSRMVRNLMLASVMALGAGCFGGEPPRRALPDEGPTLAAGQRPNFSGAWVLEPARSEDAAEAQQLLEAELRAAQASAADPTRLPAPGPASDTFRRPGRPFGDMRGFLYASDTLRITHADPRLSITTQDGDTQEFQTDQRGSTISATGAAAQQVSVAGWEGAAIVVEISGNNGVGLTRRYRLRDQASRLEVESVFTLERTQREAVVTRHYRRATP